jgi:hypothetical protein
MVQYLELGRAREQVELPAADWSLHHRTSPSSCSKGTRIGARH